MNTDTYRFNIGAFDCVAVSDGLPGDGIQLPLSFLFANAPEEQLAKVLINHGIQQDQLMSFSRNFLIVNTNEHLVLVDTGYGEGAGFKHTGKLLQNLQSEGIKASDVDIVILTHAHGDHVGGNIDAEGKPAFPNAHYFLSKDEWSFWTSEIDPELMVSNMADTVRKHLLPIREQGQLQFFARNDEIAPGIHTVAAYGHTPGHTAVSVSSEGEKLLNISDLVIHPIHLEQPDWYMKHEVMPDVIITSRRRLLDIATTKKMLVFACHLPFPGLGHVIPKQDGWEWQPIDIDSGGDFHESRT